MPNTGQGFPYPPATDPVAQGAAAIQALAEAIEAKLATARTVHVVRSTPYTTGPGGIGPASNYIPFDSARFDRRPAGDAPMWAAASPNRVTIPQAGVYVFFAQVLWDASVTGVREIQIHKNRTAVLASQSSLASQFFNNQPHSFTQGMEYLVAADYLELVLGQTAGGNLGVNLAQPYQGLRVWRVGN